VFTQDIPLSVEYAAEFDVNVVLSTLPAIATKMLFPEAIEVQPLLRFKFMGLLVAAQPTGVGVVGLGVNGVGVGVVEAVHVLLFKTQVLIPPTNWAT
jgi:hypothetical protein